MSTSHASARAYRRITRTQPRSASSRAFRFLLNITNQEQSSRSRVQLNGRHGRHRRADHCRRGRAVWAGVDSSTRTYWATPDETGPILLVYWFSNCRCILLNIDSSPCSNMCSSRYGATFSRAIAQVDLQHRRPTPRVRTPELRPGSSCSSLWTRTQISRSHSTPQTCRRGRLRKSIFLIPRPCSRSTP